MKSDGRSCFKNIFEISLSSFWWTFKSLKMFGKEDKNDMIGVWKGGHCKGILEGPEGSNKRDKESATILSNSLYVGPRT